MPGLLAEAARPVVAQAIQGQLQPILNRLQRYETAYSVINDGLNHALTGEAIKAIRNVNEYVPEEARILDGNGHSEYNLRTPGQLGSVQMACREWFEGIDGDPSVESLGQQFGPSWRSGPRSRKAYSRRSSLIPLVQRIAEKLVEILKLIELLESSIHIGSFSGGHLTNCRRNLRRAILIQHSLYVRLKKTNNKTFIYFIYCFLLNDLAYIMYNSTIIYIEELY